MSRRNGLYLAGIATASLSLAMLFSAFGEQMIVVSQAVENPFPQRMAPYGVGPRTGESTPTPQAVQMPAPSVLPDNLLAWNTSTNEVHVKEGAMLAKFTFLFTNISSAPITITGSAASCGCTTANLPDLPKLVKPRESGGFQVQMNIGGKHGTVEKTITISTDKGYKVLHVISVIPLEDLSAMSEEDRRQNLEMAIADRQAVFRADCARCHAEPVTGKTGKELFAAACGICHESDHRASMVPDLHALKHETSAAFWMTWITYGKPNSLMPAFSKTQGGILSNEQVTSLVDYLVEAIPNKPGTSFSKTDGTTNDAATSVH